MMQLIVKAPNQKIPDYPVEAQLDWTIQKLKEVISESYPSHPKVEEQKLIHGGRLLHNHLMLKDVLRQEGHLHVLHLVCSGQAAGSATPVPKQMPSQSDVGPVRATSILTDNRNVPSASGLHYRGSHQQTESVSQFQVPASGPGMMALSPEMVAQQVAAMQQFYAQYMTQFMQQAQAAGMGSVPNFPSFGMGVASSDPSSIGPHVNDAPDAVAAAAVAPADPPGANQNVRMNAQGGGPLFEEDEEGNRDWLDWFYFFSRAFVLFSIIYFYSSLGRFMVVVGISILIYMYQGGWFGVTRRQENIQRQADDQEQEPQPEPEQTPNLNVEPNQVPMRQDESEGVIDDSAVLESVQQLSPPQTPDGMEQPSTFYTVWTFVSSLFTSLIPEQPPPINLN